MRRCWVQATSSNAAAAVDGVVRALTESGFAVARERAPGDPGVVVFSEQPAGITFLRQLDAADHAAVLALATTADALRGDAAWPLLAAGARDVLAWSDGAAPRIASRLSRWMDVERLLSQPAVRANLVGRSRRWRAMLRDLVEVAAFGDGAVLLLGETGTGKELAARLVHTLDRRPRKGDLVVLDCTTIVPELSGSEFFGHERGAFTGAAGARDGAFALADGGTLFLDEVGELPPALQAQLLRVVQEGTYKRVGGNAWLRTRFRLVCATNRDLQAEVSANRFRGDLYYRIASTVIRLPALRDRREDVLPLARHFFREALPGAEIQLDPAIERYLDSRDYAGNVRDLRQLVRFMAQRHVGDGIITPGDLPRDEQPAAPALASHVDLLEVAVRRALAEGIGLKEIGRAATDLAVRTAVEDAAGNLQRAAQRLGVTDRALQLRRPPRNSGAVA